LNSQVDSNKKDDGQQEDEEKDAFRKPQDASKTGKYTPLHWASYNGHHKVVWILLKENLSPTEIDMYGNTSVHQAAAGGTDKVLKCFLMRGADVNQENARSHSPLDLATNKTTRALIMKAMNTVCCKGTVCGNSVFDFKNIRYFCESCENFFCKLCSQRDWHYETNASKSKERLICRCYTCAEKVAKYEA
jgi:ankyrin repeat protein